MLGEYLVQVAVNTCTAIGCRYYDRLVMNVSHGQGRITVCTTPVKPCTSCTPSVSGMHLSQTPLPMLYVGVITLLKRDAVLSSALFRCLCVCDVCE